MDNKLRAVSLKRVDVTDKFWAKKIRLINDVVIPYQSDILDDKVPGVEPSHALDNFRIAAGEQEGEFYGMVFQDSDVAKWLEAVAYVLAKESAPDLERRADQAIDVIAKAQQADGYLNTYFTLAAPDDKWTNLRDQHELYCAGHMIEAAVAYYEATGKSKILDVVCRMADHIDQTFGTEPGKTRGYPGHEEIELALVRLYRVTGNEKYLNLSRYFVDERGQTPHYFDIEAEARQGRNERKARREFSYFQAHLPVREQTTAEGHSVRAMYLFSAMADLALETDDQSLAEACRTLWSNVVNRRMYITGGIGSSAYQEAFTVDYDLPNDTAYAETCASIGLAFWAQRMLNLELKGEYGDVMERAFFNGILSGISLDGKGFFYVNPLEVWPETCENRMDKRHVKTVRPGWFDCACCPPNLARIVASFGQYIYSHSDNAVNVHLYAGSKASFELGDKQVNISQQTEYPWDETVKLTLGLKGSTEFTLALRIPGWCRQPVLKVNGEQVDLQAISSNGYAAIKRMWSNQDQVELILPMSIERMQANPNVRMNTGKVALQRGPIVYCLEEADNGPKITDITLPRDAELAAEFEEELLGGVVTISGEGYRTQAEWQESLYKPAQYQTVPVKIKAIPYFTWNNRGRGEMTVWIREI